MKDYSIDNLDNLSSEGKIIAFAESILTRKVDSLLLQAVPKMYPIKDYGVLLNKLRLHKGHLIERALRLHEVYVMTDLAANGYDFVESTYPSLGVDERNNQVNATLLHTRYLLAHVREARISASLEQVLAYSPLSSTVTKEAMLKGKEVIRSTDIQTYFNQRLEEVEWIAQSDFLVPRGEYANLIDYTGSYELSTHLEEATVDQAKLLFTTFAQAIRDQWGESPIGNWSSAGEKIDPNTGKSTPVIKNKTYNYFPLLDNKPPHPEDDDQTSS